MDPINDGRAPGFKSSVPDQGETARAAGSKPDMQYKIRLHGKCFQLTLCDLRHTFPEWYRYLQRFSNCGM